MLPIVAAYPNAIAAYTRNVTQAKEHEHVVAKMKGNAVSRKLMGILPLIVAVKITKARLFQGIVG